MAKEKKLPRRIKVPAYSYIRRKKSGPKRERKGK